MFGRYIAIWCGLFSIFIAAGVRTKLAKAAVLILSPIIAVAVAMPLGILPVENAGKFFGLFAGAAVIVAAIAGAIEGRFVAKPSEDQEEADDSTTEESID